MFWLSLSLAASSLLAVFRAPAKPFWYLAIFITEWGYALAAVLTPTIFLMSWKTTVERWGRALLTLSVLFCASPLWRAVSIARDLPAGLEHAFGAARPREMPQAPARLAPLIWNDLWRGISNPAVQKMTYVYSRVDGQTLSLDLYRPLHPQALLPGVLVIHGGSWQSGDKTGFEPLNRYLAARGYAVAAIDYRLAPRWIFPAARDDVHSALDWLRQNAGLLHLDAKQWVLLGRSAGGEIALAAAYDRKDPSVRGVIALYAPSDLTFAYAIPDNPLIMNSRKVIAAYLGGTPDQKPQLYTEASPLNAVDARTPPTLMIHGLRDELVWPVHAERLSARLALARRPFYFLKLPWATHGFDIHLNGPSGQLSLYAIEYFLAAVMPVH